MQHRSKALRKTLNLSDSRAPWYVVVLNTNTNMNAMLLCPDPRLKKTARRRTKGKIRRKLGPNHARALVRRAKTQPGAIEMSAEQQCRTRPLVPGWWYSRHSWFRHSRSRHSQLLPCCPFPPIACNSVLTPRIYPPDRSSIPRQIRAATPSSFPSLPVLHSPLTYIHSTSYRYHSRL